jgi:hypothetical protein
LYAQQQMLSSNNANVVYYNSMHFTTIIPDNLSDIEGYRVDVFVLTNDTRDRPGYGLAVGER